MKETIYVTWPQIEAALQATTPPLKWSKASLVRLGIRNRERLPHIRPGSRLADPVWTRDAMVDFVRCNHPQNPGIVLDFVTALDAAIKSSEGDKS